VADRVLEDHGLVVVSQADDAQLTHQASPSARGPGPRTSVPPCGGGGARCSPTDARRAVSSDEGGAPPVSRVCVGRETRAGRA
jgi:hypothetical protein